MANSWKSERTVRRLAEKQAERKALGPKGLSSKERMRRTVQALGSDPSGGLRVAIGVLREEVRDLERMLDASRRQLADAEAQLARAHRMEYPLTGWGNTATMDWSGNRATGNSPLPAPKEAAPVEVHSAPAEGPAERPPEMA